MKRRVTCLTALTAVIALAACDKPANGETAAAAAEPAGAGACRLLQLGEVKEVFAGAKRGEVDTSREQYGISACEWMTDNGLFVAQYWKNEDATTAQNEASGLVLGAVDPLKPSARNAVRYETIQGVGEQAVAVIEAEDAARGVLSDFAMLVAQRGDHILVLIAPQLARVDRAKALAGLQSLGQAAAKRL